jgi:hypothetical protein
MRITPGLCVAGIASAGEDGTEEDRYVECEVKGLGLGHSSPMTPAHTRLDHWHGT